MLVASSAAWMLPGTGGATGLHPSAPPLHGKLHEAHGSSRVLGKEPAGAAAKASALMARVLAMPSMLARLAWV